MLCSRCGVSMIVVGLLLLFGQMFASDQQSVRGTVRLDVRSSAAANMAGQHRFVSKSSWLDSHSSRQDLQRSAGAEFFHSANVVSPGPGVSGSGTTSFPGIQMRPWLRTGGAPTAVATGDFNRDGHMDFVVANALDDNLWLYLGRGDGTFQVPQVIPLTAGLSPIGIVAGDLRGTGTLDLVVADADSYSISVFLGNGDGTFQNEHSYELALPPTCITLADINHDGKLDIAAALSSAPGIETPDLKIFQLATLLGDGSGKFSAPTLQFLRNAESVAWNIVAGDLNGDGFPDLVTTAPFFPDGARVLLNDGAGNFADAESVYLNILVPANDSFAPAFTALGDLNGDGCLDSVTADLDWDGVDIRFGDCTAHFSAQTHVPMGDSSDAVLLADVNGDGSLDIVTVSTLVVGGLGLGDAAGNLLSVALNDGKGNFSTARVYRGTGTSSALAAGDFNGDGKPDVVSVSTDSDTATTYLNNGSGNFGDPQGVSTRSGNGFNLPALFVPSTVDINGDGFPDIFFIGTASDNTNYQLGVMLNDGTGRFSNPIFSLTSVAFSLQEITDYRLADLRGTGHPDFVATGLFTPYIAFAPNLGNGSFGPTVFSNLPNATGVFALADFNRDGKPDLATQNQVFFGNGDGTFRAGPTIPYSDGLAAQYIFATDVNRDGKLDLVMHSDENGGFTSNDIVWEFLGNGDGTFQLPTSLFSGVYFFSMPDLNHDGLGDLLFYPGTFNVLSPKSGDGSIGVSMGQANGGFSPVVETPSPYAGIGMEALPFRQSGPNDNSSVAVDLNGDGNRDLVAAQAVTSPFSHTYAQILVGNGDGTFTPTYDIFDFDGPYWPRYAADFDGDGRADLLQWSTAVSSFHVLKSAPAPAVQLELSHDPYSGNSGVGTVFLNTPSTGVSVALASSVAGISLPASLSIPSGALSGQFNFDFDAPFSPLDVFDVRATLGTDSTVDYGSHTFDSGFDLSVSGTANQSVLATQSTAPITLTVSSLDGYSSTVNFSCLKMFDYVGSCSFSPPSVTLPANGSATTQFVVNTTSGVATFDQTLLLIAQDGTTAKYQPFTLDIPIFRVDVQAAVPGASPGNAQFNVSASGIAPLDLSCSGLPAGASCNFSGGSNGAMTVSVPPELSAGNYPFTVTLSSNGLTTTTQTLLGVVPSFRIDPPDANNSWAPPSATATRQVTIESINASAGSPFVACATSWGGICSAGSVNVPASGSASLPLSIDVPIGTAPGNYQLTLQTNIQGAKQSFVIPYLVADYSGSLSQSNLTLSPGSSGTVTATLNASPGVTGSFTVGCQAQVPLSCVASPSTIVLSAPSSSANATITISASTSATLHTEPVPIWAFAFGLPLLVASRVRRHFRLLLIGMFGLWLVSCGGGGSTTTPKVPIPQNTSYTLTITSNAAGTTASRTLGTVNVTVVQ